MQFWPFALGILAAGVTTLCAIALFIKLGPPEGAGESPHHRRNKATDLLVAKEDQAGD